MQPRIQETPLPPRVELPPPPGAAQIPDRPITANEAALIALRNQPDITIARSGIEAARGPASRRGPACFLPLASEIGYSRSETLSGSGGGGGGGTVGGGGGSVITTPGYQTSVNLRQLLFDFGRTRNQVREAEAQLNASVANLTRMQSDLVQLVKQAFHLCPEYAADDGQ